MTHSPFLEALLVTRCLLGFQAPEATGEALDSLAFITKALSAYVGADPHISSPASIWSQSALSTILSNFYWPISAVST